MKKYFQLTEQNLVLFSSPWLLKQDIKKCEESRDVQHVK